MYQISAETDNVFLFGPNLPKKGVSSLKQMQRTPPLSSAYSNFWTKYAEKSYLGPKPKKVNIPIEFCILELV